MFDSLFLLGVGGRTVYHGPAMEARHYFQSLGFHLQDGDSQADWFLDISSGDVNTGDIEQVGDATVAKHDINGDSPEALDDDDNESKNLIPTRKSHEVNDIRNAEQNREQLYKQWTAHFDNMSSSKKEKYYLAPNKFDLPNPVEAVSSTRQLFVQIQRNCLLSWRNRYSRLVDFGIVIVAVFAITLLGGVDPSSYLYDPTQLLCKCRCFSFLDSSIKLLTKLFASFIGIKFIASESDASSMLQPLIFTYAFRGLNALSNYAMMVGLIMSVLVGLNATKVVTNNKLEFFRECQSGSNVSAFYIAASVTATVEQGLIAIVGAMIAYLVTNPSSSFLVYFTFFFINSWLSVAWAHLLAIIVPFQSVSTV